MVAEGLRFTTFLTNLIVLIGFIWLYNWIQRDAKVPFVRRFRVQLLIGLSIGFLVLFHAASLLNIANQNHPVGYGWTYLNFQVVTVWYALLSTHRQPMLFALLAVVGTWFVWMTNWHELWLVAVALVLMGLTYWRRKQLTAHLWTYYLFSLVFTAPFFYVNWQVLGGIDVGWFWQTLSLLVLLSVIWAVNQSLAHHAQRERRLSHEAHRDALTNLTNFGRFDADLQAAFIRFEATGEMYALFTFDIDHFKRINDTYGHLAGNTVLKTVAKRVHDLAAALDYDATTYRTGGEEFSILLFDIQPDIPRARAFAAKLAKELHQLPFTFNGQQVVITISLGQARVATDDKNYLDLYRRADSYLYSAKNNGRNALNVHGETFRIQPGDPPDKINY